MATSIFKLKFGQLSDEGIREELRRRGADPTSELVRASRELLDLVDDGSVTVSPQDAAMVGFAGQAAADIGEHFLTRSWVVFQTRPVLLTSDEPVTLVPAPGLPRNERPGVATAGVVLLPLDTAHVLVLFRRDIAYRLGLGPLGPTIARSELDAIETAEISREVAMNSHRWAFERPSKKQALRFSIPPAPEAFSMEDAGPIQDETREGRVYRNFKRTRWHNSAPAPLPVSWWWE